MSSLNKVLLIGRVGKDPESIQNHSTNIVKFSLATSEKYKPKGGEPVEETEWHNIVMFSKLAEIAEKYVNKGDLLYIEGKLKTNKYTDKNGVDRWSTSILANQMTMLGSKSKPNENNPNTAIKEPAVNPNSSGDLDNLPW